MGKAVFLSTPAHGHVNPTLALTAELVRRGEQVVYFATDEFREKIEHVGAEYRSYGEAPDADPATLGNVFSVAAFIMNGALDLLPELLRKVKAEEPDYLLHDAAAVWGKIAGRRLGIPAVSTCPYFATLARRGSGAWRFDLEVLRMLAADFPAALRCLRLMRELHRRYERTGGFTDVFANLEPLNLVFTSTYFQPYADAFDDRYRFVGPQLAFRPEFDEFPFDRLEGKPFIYVAMGTIFNQGLAFYRACLDALDGLDHRVVLSVGDKTDIAALGPVPANAIVRNRVPQLQLLERADLFITHGGMNSTTEGLYYGVPLIVVPQGADQVLTACRVRKLGAGVYLSPRKATPTRLREAVLHVLREGSFRQNARKIGDSFRAAGGHEQAASEVLRFVREIKGRG